MRCIRIAVLLFILTNGLGLALGEPVATANCAQVAWGPVAEGFQMAIQIDTNVFLKNEPIQINTYLRNVTTNELQRISARIGPDEGAEEVFIVGDESGQQWQALFPASGASTIDFPPKTEVKHNYGFYYEIVPIAMMPEVKPGTYKIKQVSVLTIDTNGMV